MTLGIAAASSASARADAAYTLDNGLRVIISPQPGNPVASARLMIKTGSASEVGEAEYGLAHLMEHMAFKGTAKRKVGEVSSLIETNGGDINAYTSYDMTVYLLSLPADKLELGLDILSDLVFFPTYDPGEYAREKEVVIEEINRANDSPDRMLFDEFFALSFPNGHPYGRRVLGSAETVRNASRDAALAFHDKYYRPDNAVLIVTGGFDARAAAELADKHFKDVKNPEAPLPAEPGDSQAPRGPVVKIMRSKDATQPQLIMGFRCPSAGSSEAAAIDLLASLLSSGFSSRLQESVRYKQGLVTSISSSSPSLRRSGTFIVSYVTDAEKVVPALEAVFAQLEGIVSSPPAADELARTQAIMEKSFVDQEETPWALGRQIEGFELYTGDYRLKDAYLSEWRRTTAQDLVYLARRIFDKENLVMALMLPEGEAGGGVTEDQLRAAADKLSLPQAEAAAGPAAPAFREYTLDNGVRVYFLEDRTISLLEVRAGALGGRFAEGEGAAGLSSLTAECWSRATVSKPAAALSRAVESLGASVSGWSGRNSMGLEASLLSSSWRDGLALFVEVLTQPAFSGEDFDSCKAEHLAYLLSQEENLPYRLFKILRPALYQGHPYSVDADGSIPQVESIRREDLAALYHELIRPENLTITAAGSADPEEFVAFLNEALKGWRPEGKLLKPEAPAGPPKPKGPVFVSEALDRAQTHLALAFLAPSLEAGDRAAADVLASALGGMGGVLFQELREKKSLAYTVSGSFGPGLKTGSFTFYIGTSPEKTGEAMEGMLTIIEGLKAGPFSDAVIEGAKEYLLGTNKMRHSTLASRGAETLSSVVTGQGPEAYDEYQTRIAAVTAQDVLKAAQTYLKLEESVLAVVGAEDSIKAAEGLLKKR